MARCCEFHPECSCESAPIALTGLFERFHGGRRPEEHESPLERRTGPGKGTSECPKCHRPYYPWRGCYYDLAEPDPYVCSAEDVSVLYKPPSESKRPSWDDYFLGIATAVAARADCTRAKHGAVIVKNKRIVATGYNGAPAGQPGCLTHGACPRGQKSYEEQPSLAGDYSDCIALHAEMNAIVYSSRDKTEGATIYITGEPCSWCQKIINSAGIARIVY